MNRIHVVGAVLCLVTLASPVAAGAASTRSAPQAPRASRSTQPNVPVADFNGDGKGDLAVGAPNEDDGGIRGGGVFIFTGVPGGLSTTQSILIRESGLGLTPANGDSFGAALAPGNFNGDAFDDLAVGAPGRTISGRAAAGAVFVLYGSAAGLSTDGWKFLRQGGPDAVGGDDRPEADDRFGAPMAAGDFGGASQDDLAVGASQEYVGVREVAGALSVFPGSSSGLTITGHRFLTQDTAGVPGTATSGARFAYALTAGDFGRSTRSDLAVGAPYSEVGSTLGAGAVIVLYGSGGGLSTQGAQLLREGATLRGSPATYDVTGYALAAGDFGGSSQADLAIGAPGETVKGKAQAGEAIVVYGSATGLDLDASRQQVWSQNDDGAPSTPENYDSSGTSLAAANLGHSSQSDLVIGAPYEDVGSIGDAGAVVVLYGTSSGLSSAGAQIWDQDSSGIHGVAEANDQFAYAVAGGQLGDLSYGALLAGVHGESVDYVTAAGAVNVVLGGSGGLGSGGNRIIDEASTGMPSQPDSNEMFGDAVAA